MSANNSTGAPGAPGPNSGRLGISGIIASAFVRNQVTLLILIATLLSGVFAVLITPREEEPQINVTFANVFIAFPGASAKEVEQLVTTPAEQVLGEIEGLKHIYSVSRPGMSMITVQYKVGEPRTDAILRLYDKIFSNLDWLPQNLGVAQPIVKPRSIDDIPIVTFTLWDPSGKRTAHDLKRIAHTLEAELKRIHGTRQVRTIGGPERVVNVAIDPQKLAAYGLALDDLRKALLASNASTDRQSIISDNLNIPVRAGTFLSRPEEVQNLVVGVFGGKPVYLADVATITYGPDTPKNYVSYCTGPDELKKGAPAGCFPAVTIAVAKQPGQNAVVIADKLIRHIEKIKGVFIPDGVKLTVTRNYGKTADDKAKKLIMKLIFATASVVLLVLFTMGWREAVVVGIAVISTLAVTLFASWAYGFTINRVSLFALIFSIGILVDDAIVVVENIHRHLQMGDGRKPWVLIPQAVDEVGSPTILATLTVIAALLPMAFVTGLMGPYMQPIPINASMGMMLSLAVAFIISPWLAYRLIVRGHKHTKEEEKELKAELTFARRVFNRVLGPFLQLGAWGRTKRYLLIFTMIFLLGASMSLGVVQLVILKMLPFDNKSEFKIVVDMPEGTALEKTERTLKALAEVLKEVPEVKNWQLYAGTASPVGFNGLVRQYYLRQEPRFGDIQVNLIDKHERDRKSHEIAADVRNRLLERFKDADFTFKVVEVPPGPPVLSPIVAEIYGLDYDGQLRVAKEVRKVFETTKDIVDIDDTIASGNPRIIVRVDRQRAAALGVPQSAVAQAIVTALGGEDVSYLHTQASKYPVPIRVQLPASEKGSIEDLLNLKVRAVTGKLVPLSEIVILERDRVEQDIYHKDLLPVVYVMGDMTGKIDSPLYGMFEMYATLKDAKDPVTGRSIEQHFISQPEAPVNFALKWDGEWQITYETFRDMGIAYAVGLIGIYFLIVAQFGSYLVPLIIMAPIPLTIIGVMPGHALLGAKFTATSMIGVIALAGIIVRNSILLVDFVNQQCACRVPLREAIIQSAAVRARPILLTAIAAMMGAFFILDDPIFNGLAISLIFGIFVSTILTLVVIPVLYFSYMRRKLKKMGYGPDDPVDWAHEKEEELEKLA
ncbi:efflux RND transporter permease subunit [Thermopetrobacter sp. TC1]|uniref:efflux RND transporter permease subunit n=1 Tax=Thermopetrobacter sp. TC1 TaxID=1495045 RepID=UPI0009DED151|nr:efflux RND transporter permease subunit [Thermopetrobacter sp. TC1]